MSQIDDFLDGKPAAPGAKKSQIDSFLDEGPADPGLIPTIKRTGGQMLTTAATSLEDVMGPNVVTKAMQETGQGIIDRNPAGVTSLSDVVEKPWLTVKEAVGQFAPQIGAAAAGGFAGARIGGALGGLAGPGGAAVGATIGGAAGSLLPIFTQEYGGIRQEQKEGGQEDKTRALAAAIPATALERVGMGKALNVLKGVPTGAAGSILKEAGKGALKEGATEGAQNVIEQIGAFKDPTTSKNLEDTALSAVMGGIGGGVMGAGTGAIDASRKPAQQKTDQVAATSEQPDAEPAPASAPLALPAPDRGVIQVGGDGTARTPAYQTPGYVGDVTDVEPRPIDPVREQVAAAAEQGGALSGAALTAIDTGVTQAMQPPVVEQSEPEPISLEEADARDRAAYEQFFANHDADPVVSRYFEDDSDIPDFGAASNVSDEEFLRSLGATDEDIQDAIATARQSPIPQSSPAVDAGAQANEPAGPREGAGGNQAAPGQGQVTLRQPENFTGTPSATMGKQGATARPGPAFGLKDALAQIRTKKQQEAANAKAAAPEAAPASAPVPAARPGPVEAAGVERSKLLASLDQTGATREMVLDAQLKDAQYRLAQITATTGILPADRASRLSAINQEIADLNAVRDQARELDERDRREGNTRSMLQGARQELDAAVRAGAVTPEAAQSIAAEAKKTGNAADAAEAVFTAVDSAAAAAGTAPDIKDITAKQIPDMTDGELQQAIAHYGPEHKRTAKLQKEVQRRAAQTTQGNTNATQTAQAQQTSPQPAQAGAAPAAAAAPGQAGPATPAGASTVRALNDGAPAQNPGAQAAPAAGAQGEEAQGGAVEALRQQLRDVEARIIQAAPAALGQGGGDIEAAMKSRKVPVTLKAQRKKLVEQVRAAQATEVRAFAPETGTLGIPRADMPQVPAQSHGGLVKHLNAQGIEHETTMVDAAGLKPTQAEFSPSKVEKAKEATGDRAVIVSSDGHIIDGHHQAMAAAEDGKPVKAIVLDAPVEQALEAVKNSPSAQAQPTEPAAQAKPAQAVNPRVPPENRTLEIRSASEKEPWQMTALEFSQQEKGNPHWNQSYEGKDDGAYLADTAATHRRLVQEAIAAAPQKVADDFIPAPDGGLDYGEITPEMGKAMRRQAGKIRLRRGDETQGLVHIAERHLDQFKKRGFESVPDFVASVAKSFTAIYKRDGAALDVVLEDGSRGRLVVQLEMAADGDFYDVKTASPIREDQFKNREPLWERAGTSTPTAGESSPPSPWGQNGADSVPPNATAAQPITRADVTAAQQQAATLIAERIDAMTAGEVNTIARRFLPTMGVKPTVSKERNKAAVTDFTKVNPIAAADEFGVTLPADVRRALEAEMQGKVADGFVEPAAAKPAAAPQPAAPAAPIEDAGEKIGGARKDRWKERGLNLDDLDAMTEAEGAELATKANVWKPDYEALAAQSEPVTAAMVKTIYDQLAAKPKQNTPEGRRQYVQMMRIVRDVYTEAKGPEAVKNAYLEIRKRAGLNAADPAAKSAGRELLFSVYKGRSDPFVLGYTEMSKAKKLVEDGFPAKGEPWKTRLSVGRAEGGPGTTERGIEIYVERSAEVGTPLTREQILGGFYRVTTKDNRTVAFAPTKADAEAAAATVYERDMKGKKDGKPEPVRPNLDELKRENLPQRIDRDVTSEDFVRDLGFRGVEFGNWSAQDERQRILNMAYDGLMDLAEIMGVPPKAMSLNGTLGMAFGARGGGRFAAHYEPGKLVINMTKIRGGGSMAHEWAHAMDHYFGELDKADAYTTQARGASGWYTEDQYNGVPRKRMERVGNEWKNVEKMRLDNLRPEMAAAFDEVMRALFQKQITKAEMVRSHELDLERTQALARSEQDAEMKAMYQNMVQNKREALNELRNDPEGKLYAGRGRSDYAQQAQALSGKSVDGYWVRPTEMFARAFESWVFDRVTAMGARSDYLVHGVEEDRFAGGGYKGNPYPTGEERARINAAFDKLTKTIKTKETDTGNVAMFSRSPSTKSAYEARIDALFAGEKAAGPNQGARVLDRSDVLGLLGFGDGPVNLAEGKVIKGQENHPRMTAEQWKKVPEWLDNPAAVFDSDTVAGALVLIAPETINGATVRMTVEPRKGGGADVHILSNAYDAPGFTPFARWFREGLGRLVDQKKFPTVLGDSGLQLSSSTWQNKPGTRKILTEKHLDGYRRANNPAAFMGQPTPRADSNARNVATQLLVDGLKAKWTRAPEIIVARNMQDAQIPQEVRDYDALLKSQGATGEARGFIYKGVVYLLSDQLKGPQQIAEVLFHEVLGHYGLRGAFGDGLTPILQQMGTMRRRDVVAKAREYGLFDKDALGGLDKAAASDAQIWAAMSAKQRLEAAEEVLAEMAQTQPNISFVQRAIAAIRNWLRANVPGFKNLKLTDADIVQAYILPARGYVTRSRETGAQSLERAMRDAGFSRAPAGDQTQTEAFKRWFGDSKVVDADGKPLVSRSSLVAARKSAMLEGRMNGGSSNAKSIADLLVSQAFSLKGLGGLEIPAQRKVLNGVLSLGDDFKVLRSVVDLVPVDVVNILTGKNLAPEMLFRDEAMLKQLLSADRDGSVSTAIDIADALVVAVAGVAAKGSAIASNPFAGTQKVGSAADTGDADELHDAILNQTTGNNGNFDPSNPDIRFSRTTEAAKAAGDAIKSVTVTNIKQRAGFKLTDYLGIGLQALGRRQIVDLYGDMLPLAEYNRLVTQMESIR